MIGSDVQKTVAFIGFQHKMSPGGIRATGTAFLVHYDGQGYLVTARHCLINYGDRDTLLRINTMAGSQLILTPADTDWTYHDDEGVDVAVMPSHLPLEDGFDCQYINESMIIKDGEMADLGISEGDLCYTVGLFRYIYGHERNLPVIYTGNIALLSENYLPGWDPVRAQVREVRGSLIQTPGIHGSSGSPVFVRRVLGVGKHGLAYDRKVRLFGLLASAWFLPPDDALRQDMGAKKGDTVPVGLGIVIQASRIIETIKKAQLRYPRSD